MKLFFEKAFSIQGRWISCEAIIEKGKVNLLIGNNGVGKSTLLSFLFEAYDFGGLSVSLSEQKALKSVNHMRVLDLITTVSSLPQVDEIELHKMLDEFSFKSLYEVEVNCLSGGENQILKTIILLSQSRDVYLIDEPFQFLDAQNIEKILKLIERKMFQKLVLVVEHNWSLFKQLDLNIFEMKKSGKGVIVERRA